MLARTLADRDALQVARFCVFLKRRNAAGASRTMNGSRILSHKRSRREGGETPNTSVWANTQNVCGGFSATSAEVTKILAKKNQIIMLDRDNLRTEK